MRRRLIYTLISLFIASIMQAQPNPVSWSTSTSPEGDGITNVVFTASIQQGWHMYDMGPYEGGPNPTVFTFKPSAGIELVGPVECISQPVRKFEDMFGMEIGYFEGSASFAQKVRAKDGSVLKANVEWMCCNDSGCIPPSDEDFEIRISAAADAYDTVADTSAAAPASRRSSAPLWSIVLQAMFWGLVALATPCVFPMVPMTVSYFIKGSEDKKAGRFRAFMYGLFIVLLYTLPIAVIIIATRIIGGEAVTADIFNWFATHWLPNIIFFIVFMIFAASFFGFFEITLPSRLVNGSDSKSDRKGLGGIFFMALTLVLVSFSCTGPIVGTVLIKSTSGEFWAPMVTMLAFSVAFALPFTLLALFPSWLKRLPKSGGWLNTVKVSLGFIEIALGFKFLSVADQTYQWGILGRKLYLAIWLVCFTLLGLYLLGVIRFPSDGPRPDKDSASGKSGRRIKPLRLSCALASFAFVLYMIPGLWGAPLKALSGYLPPAEHLTVNNHFYDFEEAQAYAEKVDKPLFIEFSGLGCVNCREMEAKVLSYIDIKKALDNHFVVVTLYGDDKTKAPRSRWVRTEQGKLLKTVGQINSYMMNRKFGISAQPYYVIMAYGHIIAEPHPYDLNIQNFCRFIDDALAEFERCQEEEKDNERK